MSLVPKEILLSHLQRAEGAKEVTLPIDFFRDLLYQAMPRTWAGLTDDERQKIHFMWAGTEELTDEQEVINLVEDWLKEKNT